MAEKSDTSAFTTSVRRPRACTSPATPSAAAWSTSARTMSIPPSASASTMPRPMPLPAPVTTATLPPMSLIGRSLWPGPPRPSTLGQDGQDGVDMSEAVIRWGAWYEDRDLHLAFPDSWDVEVCLPADGPDIGDRGIAAAFAAPF